METVIRFDKVSKRYQLGSRRAYLQHLLPKAFAKRLARRTKGNGSSTKPDELWALNDVSFDIGAGEMVGLIGANGAGKTTALSLLAEIITPTSGQILVRGKVGALIKLGAGFHPDLTGRENVYLNGSILGLRRAEIDALYDQIVAFAELEPFMQTPVKRYSSGMYVRLGFAVAVHVRPDILLVDEILSVGDVSFQARCFNKIGEIRDSGTTIVMVSHNMHHIASFCDRVVYLDHGRVQSIGEPTEVLAAYTAAMVNRQMDSDVNDGSDMSKVNGTGRMVINDVCFLDRSGNAVEEIRWGEPATVRLYYQCNEDIQNPLLDVVIRDTARGNLFQATNREFGFDFGTMSQSGYIDITFKEIVSNNQVLNFFFTLWNSEHTEQYDWKRFIKLYVAGLPTSSGRMLFDCTWNKI
ncbi:MAG: ABC transporter ATP-binding protein [Caldilineaceae bacterium]|nr:ABC transporter ATP-binding protein [Caldilineaceae bacterium]